MTDHRRWFYYHAETVTDHVYQGSLPACTEQDARAEVVRTIRSPISLLRMIDTDMPHDAEGRPLKRKP